MTSNREKRDARALQAARGDGASYSRALHDLREWVAEGRDPVALVLAEGGTIKVLVIAWEVSPPVDEDESLLFAVVQVDGPAVVATSADDDSAPVVDVEQAVRSVVPVDPEWHVDRADPVTSINSVLVDGFAWDITLEPFQTWVRYTRGERGLPLGVRLRDCLDRAYDEDDNRSAEPHASTTWTAAAP